MPVQYSMSHDPVFFAVGYEFVDYAVHIQLYIATPGHSVIIMSGKEESQILGIHARIFVA